MISGIRGNIIASRENEVQIEAGNFHFRVLCPSSFSSEARVGQEIFLHTHLHVREDDLSIYGFATERDLLLFEHLISVSGIGPKGALEYISAGEKLVVDAIISKDLAFLTNIKGVGKKTANRMILELGEKLSHGSENSFALPIKMEGKSKEEAISALEGLGWKQNEIRSRLQKLPQDIKGTEKIVKWFLTQM